MYTIKHFSRLLVTAILLVTSWSATAASDIFLKLDGVPGESVDAQHANEIDVLAWSWGLSNNGTVTTGGGGAGKASFQDLSFTKYLDKASPKLMLATCNGKHIQQAVLTLRRAGDKPFEYLKITLEDILVTSVATGGSGGEGRPVENITFRFARVKFEYTTQKPDGGPGEAVSFGWDIAQNLEI